MVRGGFDADEMIAACDFNGGALLRQLAPLLVPTRREGVKKALSRLGVTRHKYAFSPIPMTLQPQRPLLGGRGLALVTPMLRVSYGEALEAVG